MSPISRLIPRKLRKRLEPASERWLAMKSSWGFDPQDLGSEQFIRLAYYTELKRWAQERSVVSRKLKAIEFGGSNRVIQRILSSVDYEVAPNWPEVDVQDLRQYPSESFDIVVIDQILEHVADPWKTVGEIKRVLKEGGTCLCATPFLVRIHGSYGDYWRFTELGLKTLFRDFSSVDVFSWGNRLTLQTTMRHGWLDCAETKRRGRIALWNEPAWPIVYLTKAAK